MGCDIHSIVQTRNSDGSWSTVPSQFYDDRSYGLFALLADVRNYSEVPTIHKRRGLPDDIVNQLENDDEIDGVWLGDHSFTWYTLDELLDFNYKQRFVDKREFGNPDCAIEDIIPDYYFSILEELKKLGDPKNTRIVMGFDN